MNYKVIEKNNQKYIELFSAQKPIGTEGDALDIVAACGEIDTNLLMIHGEVLSDDFFNLKTGLAGAILQKFINYHVRAAIVIDDESKITGRFKELVSEVNRGKDYGFFNSKNEAENWLVMNCRDI